MVQLARLNSAIPLESLRIVSVTSFHGQTLFSEPTIKPAKTAMVMLWYFFSNHESTFEKDLVSANMSGGGKELYNESIK